jgi:hypothetical protein
VANPSTVLASPSQEALREIVEVDFVALQQDVCEDHRLRQIVVPRTVCLLGKDLRDTVREAAMDCRTSLPFGR